MERLLYSSLDRAPDSLPAKWKRVRRLGLEEEVRRAEGA
jgi:hypothetical protein